MWEAPKELAERYFSYVTRCLTDEDAFNKFKSEDDYKSIVGMSYK